MPINKPSRLARPAALSDLLLYRINYLFSVGGSMATRLCEGRFGVTRREWRLLALLASEEGVRSSELAEHAQLDRARTSRAVTALVSKKLVRRELRPGGGRQAVLVLTAKGRELYETLFPLIVQINHDLLAGFTDKEVAALDGFMDRLQRRSEEMVMQAELPKADRRRGRPAA